MSAEVVRIDRSLSIDRHQTVKTGWIPIHTVKLACTVPMSMGDVDRAYQRVLNNGPGSWPPPVGHFDGGAFVLSDGRHEFVARLMLGQQEMFVAWVDGA